MVQVDDEADRVLWCGNLDEKVTDELLYELFLQAGPLEKVKIVQGPVPRYAFITFQHRVSVPYTIQLMNGIRLFDRPLRLQVRTGSANGPAPSSGTPGPLSSSLGFSPAPAPLLPPVQLRHSVPLQQPWHGNAPGSSGYTMPVQAQIGMLQQQHVQFHRSWSEPEGLGAMRNSRRMAGNGGAAADSRTPYSRPVTPHREFTEPSPSMSAQFPRTRQMMTPCSTYTDSRWNSSSRRGSQYPDSANSRPYR
jgi:RNA recognition motif-containing protein